MHLVIKSDFTDKLCLNVQVIPADEQEHDRLAALLKDCGAHIEDTSVGNQLSFQLAIIKPAGVEEPAAEPVVESSSVADEKPADSV